MECSGGDGSGGEGRGGQGRAGQGRAGQGRADCLGGLSRVGISSRSTRPWNGQPPSYYKGKGMVLYSAVSSPLDRSKRFTLYTSGSEQVPVLHLVCWYRSRSSCASFFGCREIKFP